MTRNRPVLTIGLLILVAAGAWAGSLTASFSANDPSPEPGTLSLAPGAISAADFQVRVEVSQMDDFFGAGFRVVFDSAVADYLGFSGEGTFLTSNGNTVLINAVLSSPGVVSAVATIQDASVPAGIDVSGTQLLLTLNFRATAATESSPFEFSNVEIQLCPTAGGACATGSPVLSGGKLVTTPR